MGDLITKIVSIVENLLVAPIVWLFPIKWCVIIPGSSAVRFTFGKPSHDLNPGIHFATCGQTLHKRHVRTNLGVAESMYVLTEDGLSIKVRGVVIYEILSLVDFMTITEDSDQFVVEACEAAIRYAISRVPYEDLVNDSDTVESAIGEKITEICKGLGILVKRYRFQDIEITDHIGRSLSSIKSMSPRIIESVSLISKSLGVSHNDALAAMSPNIQFVVDVLSNTVGDTKQTMEDANEY